MAVRLGSGREKAWAVLRLVVDTDRKEIQWQRKTKIRLRKTMVAKKLASEKPKPLQEKSTLQEAGETMRSLQTERFPVAAGDGSWAPSRANTLSEQQPPTVTIPRQPWFVAVWRKKCTTASRISHSRRRARLCAVTSYSICRSLIRTYELSASSPCATSRMKTSKRAALHPSWLASSGYSTGGPDGESSSGSRSSLADHFSPRFCLDEFKKLSRRQRQG